ncbi:MAG: 1-phosphofructokinase [Chloroflexi bacterium RBG_19FT_COMBO_47_9]|nr:MAG: 1-phosphofructokinase [Chloroflexi bacterium RBG_19FT_COMBO_47_9]
MIYTITLNPALDREMTVPEMDLDRVLRANAIQTDYGGKGFNVSRALLALGVESIALGFIGGVTGDQMIAGLSQLGIRTDFVRVQGETRINMIVVDVGHTHYLKVNEPGPLVTDIEAEVLLDKMESRVNKGDWCVLAGSTPPGIKPRFITEIVQRIQSLGAFAILDMEGACLRAGCEANAFLVKPNVTEAGELLGNQIRTIDDALIALARIHLLGARQVAISLGKTGAVYSDGTGTWWAKPPSIRERNPIGAGDAMLAGMVWALQMNLTGNEVLKWGVASGAAAASLDGTAMGSSLLVETLAADVRIYE